MKYGLPPRGESVPEPKQGIIYLFELFLIAAEMSQGAASEI